MSRRITLLLLLTLFTYAVLWAQNSNNYTFTTGTNGSFEDLSSGSTQLHGPSSGALAQRASFSLSDFDFFMMGSRYGIFNVGSNGLIDLNTGNFNIPNNGLFHAGQTRLAAFSVLTNSNARVVTSASGKVHYKLVGNAPNRCLVIEFLNMHLGIAGSQTATWQVKLYETTGVVEMVYGAMGANGNLSDVQIGLANGNTAGQYISIATATQTASTSAITNNSYSQSTLSDLDSPNEGSRRFYRFTPIVPQAPAGISITNPTSGTLTLSLQASPTPEAYRFVIYRASQPGGPFLYHTLSTSNSFTDINLSANTTYYYQVRAITEGGVSAAVTVNGTTLNNGHIRAKATGGDWSSASTWEGDVVPSRNDTVTIPAGTTVNINTTASCATLTNHGRLPFTANTSLSVFGDLVNSATGSITAEASGSRGIFLYDGHLTNAGTLDFSMTSNYISINLNQSRSFTNSGTIVGTDASGTPANTPIIRRFTINTSVSPVNPIPATLTLNFPLIISENLNLGYGFISNSQPITFDNTQVKPGTTAGAAVGVIHFGGSTTGILGPVAFGANATYNVQYSTTYSTGVQIAG
nr:hypothetical protein [Chitinophagaceae bacterium]